MPKNNFASQYLLQIFALFGTAVLHAQVAPMPPDLQRAVDDARYSIEPSGPSLRADNPANRFSVKFFDAQTSIETGSGSPATLTVSSYGWGPGLHSAGPITHVTASGKHFSREYGLTLQEWFDNSARGLEEGFVLSQRDQPSSGPLRILLSTTGGWHVLPSANGIQLTKGSTTLEYGGLKAWDSTGATLPSGMHVLGSAIEIEVDDSRAVYPLTVDPAFTQQAVLTASDGGQTENFANVLALSTDGNTALVGASGKNNRTGAAYVFTRSSKGVWTQPQELTAPDGASGDVFGSSVAISGDGNTAMVGALMIQPNVITNGAAYVFVRSGTTWTLQDELSASDPSNDDFFGDSVSLSTDGNTALVGASGNNLYAGAAYVFSRSGTSWSIGQKITVSTSATDPQFGYAVALSGNGGTALVSAHQPNSVYVFTRSGANWTLQNNLIESANPNDFGLSLALSSDGSTALIGACSGFPSAAGFVFSRVGTVWTLQQQLSISATGYTGYTCLGGAVALSADGNTALLNASGAALNSYGTAFVFGRSDTTWTLHEQIPASATSNYSFGESVALSGDSSTALVGEYGIAHVYLYEASASAGPPTVVSVSPSAGSAASQTFSGVYFDPNGIADLASTRILFNANINGANACYITYYPSAKAMYLESDAGTTLSTPVAPGSSTTVSNSQCTLSGKGSSYAASGSSATLTVAITFTHTPPENIYLLDTEVDGSSSGWVQEGTWGATLGVPATISVTPDSGTGTAQIFSALYSDPNGAHDFATVRALFNSTLNGTNACYVEYNRVSNALYLANDAGQLFSSPVIPGSSTQVSNSQCTLSGTGSSYTASGNDATLDVALTFKGVTPQLKITAPNSAAAQAGYFGSSVSLSTDSNTALIGSEGYNDFSGGAYLLTRSATGWSQPRLFTPSDAADNFFGASVVLSGDGNTALVGASGNIESSGAAYLFVRSASGWTQQQRISAPSPSAADGFGGAVALSSTGIPQLSAPIRRQFSTTPVRPMSLRVQGRPGRCNNS